MFAFRADHLVMDNYLLCFSLEKTTFPIQNISQLPLVLSIGLMTPGFFSLLFGVPIGVVLMELVFGSYVCDTLWV